jgi:ribosomal-protein-alanine N-acetyltransferase
VSNDPPFAAVETARMILRLPRAEDAKALSVLMTPEISRWLTAWPSPLTEAFAAARIAHGCARAQARAAMPMTIVRRADANVMGFFGVSCDGVAARTAMLGFWLGEAFQRQGYMREAVPAGIAAAFDFLDVDMIEAGVQLDNAPLSAVLSAAGMSPLGKRMVFAETRGRDELCLFYQIKRPI